MPLTIGASAGWGANVTEADGRGALERIQIANEGEVISRLRLSAAEAARVCAVTPRQLIYWTRKGLIRPAGDGERDYDVFAMDRAIRIRQALAEGHSLDKAAQLVERDLAARAAEVDRLAALDGEGLESELRRRLERLEEWVGRLRHALPVSLTLARLRGAVALLTRLETAGALQAASVNGEAAKAVTLRLDRAVAELEALLAEVGTATG